MRKILLFSFFALLVSLFLPVYQTYAQDLRGTNGCTFSTSPDIGAMGPGGTLTIKNWNKDSKYPVPGSYKVSVFQDLHFPFDFVFPDPPPNEYVVQMNESKDIVLNYSPPLDLFLAFKSVGADISSLVTIELKDGSGNPVCKTDPSLELTSRNYFQWPNNICTGIEINEESLKTHGINFKISPSSIENSDPSFRRKVLIENKTTGNKIINCHTDQELRSGVAVSSLAEDYYALSVYPFCETDLGTQILSLYSDTQLPLCRQDNIHVSLTNPSVGGTPAPETNAYSALELKVPCPSAWNPDDKGCDKIQTALGPIDTDPQGFVTWLLAFILSLSGGIVVLLIIASGYRLMTSQGDPEKIKEAKERLTAAIVGLLFIIFSLVILQTITLNIFHIPGFR